MRDAARIWCTALLVLPLACLVPAPEARAQELDVSHISLDSLLAVPVHAAARYAQAVAYAPASVSIVTAAEIEALGMRTLGDVLSAVPGIYLSDDRNYAYVGVRGFSRPSDYNNRLLVLLNGHTMNENVYGSAFVGLETPIDMGVVERVEVVRGPASALYGSNAMLAVVNIVTARTVSASTYLEAGSHRNFSAGGRWAGGIVGGTFLAAAMAGSRGGEDFHFPELEEVAPGASDVVGHDGERWGGGFAQFQRGGLRVQGRASARQKEIPTGAWSTLPQAGTESFDLQTAVDASYARALSPALGLEVRTNTLYYHYSGEYPDAESDISDYSDALRIGTGAQLLWDVSPRKRFVLGFDGSWSPSAHYRSFVDGETDYEFDRPFTMVAAYAQGEIHAAPWLTFVLGARSERESDRDPHTAPRVALIARPASGTTLKLIHGQAFRTPNAFETGTDGFEYKQVGEIRPERIRVSELVVEQRVGRDVVLRATGFEMNIRDLIDLMYDEFDGMLFYSNRSRGATRGIEGEMTAATGPWLTHVGAIVQRSEDPLTGDPLSNAPEAIGRVSVTGSPIPRTTLGIAVRGETGRQTVQAERTSAWASMDAALRFRMSDALHVQFRGRNLLDAAYHAPASMEHPQASLPQPRRSLHLQLEYLW